MSLSAPSVALYAALEAVTSIRHNRLAVVEAGVSLTYEGLLRRCVLLAKEISEAGILPADRVCGILDNSTSFILAAFAVWKTGATFVPINPEFRLHEAMECVVKSDAVAVIADERRCDIVRTILKSGSRSNKAWLLSCGGESWSFEAAAGIATPHNLATKNAEFPAVIQFSTGSTGAPKVVSRSQPRLLLEAQSVASVLKVSADDRIVGAVPFFHSYGLVTACLTTLLCGGTLYPMRSYRPRRLAELIEASDITGLPGVPFIFQHLAEMREAPDLTSLRYATSAGAPLPARIRVLFERKFHLNIRALYGTTETGVISVESGENASVHPGCVGVPIPGVSVEIVDRQGSRQFVGEEGLVSVQSQYAAQEYAGPSNDSDSHFDGTRFFPGDRGQILMDGQLCLCGRIGRFINVGGYKVSASEVEAAILEIGAIAEVAVVGRVDSCGLEIVKAFVVCRSPMAVNDIRAHCLRRLAPYKCPSVVEFRNVLPKSPMGKVLRKYL